MINLISPEQKRDIRAARANVTLMRYSLMLLAMGLLVGLIYALGFWLVNMEKNAVEAKRESQAEQIRAYAVVEKEATTFRNNLKIAKNILSKETSYSKFLTTLAGDLPSGAVLTSLSIGSATQKSPKPLLIDARTNSYAKVLELKTRLEQSSLFENVSLVNATRPNNLTALSGLEARYPFEATYSVNLTPGAASSSGAQQ
jgi:Tfp pilus assembly protein PilN